MFVFYLFFLLNTNYRITDKTTYYPTSLTLFSVPVYVKYMYCCIDTGYILYMPIMQKYYSTINLKTIFLHIVSVCLLDKSEGFQLLLFHFSLCYNPALWLLAYLSHCENTVDRLVLRIHTLQLHPYLESILVVWERLILQQKRTASILLRAYQRKTQCLYKE